MHQFITVQCESGVGRITLNRPEKRNALKREFIEEINSAISRLAADSSLRALVIQAEGSVFCAGMDLGQMQERATSENGAEEWQRDSDIYCDLLTRLFQLPVPTIAAVSGPALAGGMGIVLACDLVIASDNAFFMLPEPMRGITAAMVTPFLIHRVGSGPATYMLLSGERVSAARAGGFGLCHDVVPADELCGRVNQLVEAILTGSPAALAITKQHVQRCAGIDLLADVKMSATVSAEARETADAREGLDAFLQKRKPNWQPD